ncbi:MAG: PAS domain S-box protein [Thermodesulfobacteriota bacterium]
MANQPTTDELTRRLKELETEVSELRRVEEALKVQKAYLELLIDSAPEAILLADNQHRITKINPQFVEMFQFTQDEALGKRADGLIARGEKKDEAAGITEQVGQGEVVRIETVRYRKDGGQVHVELMAAPVCTGGRQIAVYASYRDITARKQAEDSVREAEWRYRSLFENSPVGIGIASEDGTLLDYNDAILKPGGYLREDIEKLRGIADLYYDTSERKRVLAMARRAGYINNLEVRFKRKDGTPYQTLLSLRPLKIRGEACWFAIVQDITDQKRAETALRESEGKFRTLSEQSPDMIFINREGRVVYANRRCEEITGFSKEELLSPEFDFVHLHAPEYHRAVKEKFAAHMRGEELEPYECVLVTREGRRVDVLVNTRLIDYQGGRAILGTVVDITEKKRLQAQLAHAQKMEAIGTLAGGIAHDFNNLLMGIQGRTSLMLLDVDSTHSHYEHLKGIEGYVVSAAELTKQLLGFARGGKYEVTPTDLNDLLRKSSEMFGRTRKEIMIHTRYEADLWPVDVDRGQIEQVFLNLFVNAWQSMPGGGDLILETRNVRLEEKDVKAHGFQEGRYVRVSVTDTGVGMDEKTRERIFEPFFTTKEMGRGTGLGLASAYGIIRNHGGMIRVQSRQGAGTTFHIDLPASSKDVRAEKADTQEIPRGTETILLVDDETMILDVGEGMLGALGYKVLLARSGSEAVTCYREKAGEVDVVILDMIMPKMGGGETYDALKKLHPGVKVLLSSGYSIDGQAQEILDRGCYGFVQKPFNLPTLARKLREILDR